MVIREGKAKELVISIGMLEPIGLMDAYVKLHDSGIVEVDGMDLDPNLKMSCHICNCEIAWDFTERTVTVTPSPTDGSVTPFRPRKK